jgi:hypothetical protein|nr:MAG TPA: hypothetical protein [Caudoviricetes sp.]
MNKEDLFCTPAQAAKLKSLGVAQKSLYTTQDKKTAVFSAPELGAMLPPKLNGYHLEQWRYDRDGKENYCIAFKGWENRTYSPFQNKVCFGKTEAQARASYLIYLLENKIIEVETINIRLLAA